MSHAHTVALIRQLQAIGPLKKPARRIPQQAQPDGIRLEYSNAIRYVSDLARQCIDEVRDDILRDLAEHRRELGHTDADRPARARTLIDRAAARFVDRFRPHALHDLTRSFGKKTTAFQRTQFDRQIRAAIGIPYAAIEKPIRDNVEDWSRENVELIRTVPDRYFEQIRQATVEAYEKGTHPTTLAGELIDIYDMSLDNARRIARDQVGKLNGQVNQARQESLGIDGYIWRTMRDVRVRDNHEHLEGTSQAWSAPPMGGGTTPREAGHPGSGIQCRCYSEPDFSAIIGS